ncbi:NAD(P)-binding domain-containing protein [Grimontia marina]|uniref:2-hydroxy-3-oxopropionate reductase n=1 Tax=Grimontia marina TaxID=646534 RepID=A0A128F236_9GAMM|nr:NAD(P)-binding domain-containing protein [Grimontia marina]CZF80853.1 2-hydroxy-3-oxopropionate reductase [Grimontia marina]
MDIGFIGLGKLGEQIATRVLAWCKTHGCHLYVYDIVHPIAMKNLVAAGAYDGKDIPSIAQRCTILFTVMAGPEDIIAVAAGTNGILENADGMDIWFELSPFFVPRWDSLRERAPADLLLMDTPVTGSEAQARMGELGMALEGCQSILQRYQSVLGAFIARCQVTELPKTTPTTFRLPRG